MLLPKSTANFARIKSEPPITALFFARLDPETKRTRVLQRRPAGAAAAEAQQDPWNGWKKVDRC